MTAPTWSIVGGGFGGLAAARASPTLTCEVTVIDRRNHHLFQPLLYQVATAGLNPVRHRPPDPVDPRPTSRTSRVLLAEVVGIDPDARQVTLDDGTDVSFDYLVVATGTTHSYFGNDEWETHAPGLKTIEDALEIRRRVLLGLRTGRAHRRPGRQRRPT